MAWVVSAIAAGTISAGTAIAGGSAILGAVSSSRNARRQQSAADNASMVQQQQAQASIDEQRRQFGVSQNNIAPYLQIGTDALNAQRDLLGLNRPYEALTSGVGSGMRTTSDGSMTPTTTINPQQNAIDALQNSPIYQSLLKSGEDALLQNQAATGGIRGGNTQAALAQYRPQMLNELINQQLNRLGGLSAMGQNSAVGAGAAGANLANQISMQNTQIGAAQAGAQIANANAANNRDASYGNILGTVGGLMTGQNKLQNLFGGFGGGLRSNGNYIDRFNVTEGGY